MTHPTGQWTPNSQHLKILLFSGYAGNVLFNPVSEPVVPACLYNPVPLHSQAGQIKPGQGQVKSINQLISKSNNRYDCWVVKLKVTFDQF